MLCTFASFLLLIPSEGLEDTSVDVEQLHVTVVGEKRVVVSWASPSGKEANLTIEEVDWNTRRRILGTQQSIWPTAVSYSWKNADERVDFSDLYASPLLLHAEAAVRPGSNYRYGVGNVDASNEPSMSREWRYFRAPPAVGHDRMRVAVVGDLGQTSSSRETCESLAKAHAAHALDVAVLVGDLAYADGNASRWDSFGRLFDEAGCADVPWLVLPGNHEIDPDELSGEPFVPYRRRWRTPEARPEEVGNDFAAFDWDTYDFRIKYDYGGSFWALRLGPVHFVALNPYTSASEGSPQIQWLEQELLKFDRSLTPYLVVLTHAPWHSSSVEHQSRAEKATRQLQEAAERRLVAVGADLVLAGHVHASERTQPIQGIRHITLGNGGNYELLYNEWQRMPFSDFHQGEHYGWGEFDFWRDAYSLLLRRSSDSAIVDSVVVARSPVVARPEDRGQSTPGGRGPAVLILVVALAALGCVLCCVIRRSRTRAEDRQGFKESPAVVGSGLPAVIGSSGRAE